MIDNVWYHVAAQADDEEAALLWMVARDDSGYTCRVWPVEGFERRKLEAWLRMAGQRVSHGLAVDAPPDIPGRTPEEAHFSKIHEARAYLGTTWNPNLRRHAAEFFRQVDPVKYPAIS
jgi:hypothetical protein